MNNNWYESWFSSPYYKLLYQNRDSIEAEAFVEKLIAYLKPLPGSRMLDIACGNGRHSIQLAERGFDVTGIDLSIPSILEAQQRTHEDLQFFVHDMRQPFYINYFDYAFNFFTSFGYFTKPYDNTKAATSFAKGLKKGGILVIDYLNYFFAEQHLVAAEEAVRGAITFHITRKVEDGYFVKDIQFKDEEGQQHHYLERVSAFQLADFNKLFKDAGFGIVTTFGDYNLSDYDPLTSPRLIMVFKK